MTATVIEGKAFVAGADIAEMVNKNQEVIKHSIRWFRDNKRHPERKVVLDGPPYEGSDYKIYYKTVE